ncbi:hypothetical protein AVEN_87821-1 [Araneus ventricosus]|uniref:Histone-lysine N-methyltransferase SETMAR n=1 Tax=Araneus ventricosus TaxID=182803 RepID=A0A4Y2BDV0_ARAVE|nr:hypothetical protein AVEN_87821-1 [Araneus ventricosus]
MATVIEEQRSVVCFLWAKGIPAKDIHKEMLSVSSEIVCPLRRPIVTLYRNFRMEFDKKSLSLLTRGILFHHDNARHHTARLTEKKTDEFWWQLLQHPHYSPKLVARFITCLVRLNRKRFATDADAEREVQKWLRQQSKDY